MAITIYHNPLCGTSRNALAMIRHSGEEPEIIEYLTTPPTRGRPTTVGGTDDGTTGTDRRRRLLGLGSTVGLVSLRRADCTLHPPKHAKCKEQ